MDFSGQKIHRLFLKLLSCSYLTAAIFHLLDIFDLRLHFSQMEFLWKVWTLYSAFADILVAFALLSKTRAGELLFIAVVLTKITVYLGWSEYFGNQYGWIGFHLATLIAYSVWLTYRLREEMNYSYREG